MKSKRIISFILSLVLLAGMASVFPAVTAVYADNSEGWAAKVNDEGDPLIQYMNQGFDEPEMKLETMDLVYEDVKNGYQLWYEYYTGEVVCINTATGQMLWSNPYDVSGTLNLAAAATKQRLISQIILTYQLNGTTYTMLSYVEAAQKGQITLKKIKGGIRVEYTMGDEITQRLVPRLIEANRYREKIAKLIPKSDLKAYARMGCKYIYDNDPDCGFYLYYDINDPSYSERKVLEIIDEFPIAEKMAFFVLDPETSAKELSTLEKYIFKYCPLYTYDELEYDHELTGYVAKDENPPLFRMALEYTIGEDGLSVRLPANGIRFDESTYKLTSVSVLPWMGCGSSANTGYTFIPDGSGSLIRFEDIKDTVYNVSGQMYGADYAYHEITSQHAETMRFPVYGVVNDHATIETSLNEKGQIVREATIHSEGYCAIITEGDTMASLMSSHGGSTHIFNTVYPSFCPRPYDSYNLADSVAVGRDATWTVTSSRKYNGSYRIKYLMLTNEEAAEAAGLDEYYEASYVGMAKAYRDYLEENGKLTRLTKDDVESDIPLYIESFGSLKTADRFLTVPVEVDTPLTTFEDVKTMYDEFAAEGVNNVNFRLRGFSNGGLKATVPTKLKWVEVLGGAEGFADLIKYSKEKGFGVYPDFDFTYINDRQTFDGLNLKKHAVRTIDNRYTSKRYYDAATQEFENDFALALSPSVFAQFYDGMKDTYAKFEPTGISVATLGTDLNSDFDQKEPYNREDAKNFTTAFLDTLSQSYDVMIDGGNAFTFPYVDHILNMATESSKYMKASESVPFIGMALHGYIRTAGTAFNMEGDIETALLRAIENGSGLYFIMSYRNTEMLKESEEFCDYFSVGYDTWKADAIKYYKILNDALKDCQTSLIDEHEFIAAKRVASEAELAADAEVLAKIAEDKAAAKAEADRIAALQKLRGETGKKIDVSDDEEEEETEEEGGKKVDVILTDEQRLAAKYDTVTGTVVKVAYDNGAEFILNYNSFDVTAEVDGEEVTVPALYFVRLDKNA